MLKTKMKILVSGKNKIKRTNRNSKEDQLEVTTNDKKLNLCKVQHQNIQGDQEVKKTLSWVFQQISPNNLSIQKLLKMRGDV